MRAGTLRHIINFQTATEVADGMGGKTHTWANVPALTGVHAAIWPLRAKERLEGGQVQHETTHTIRVRYNSTISQTMRIVFGTRTFEINGIVNPDERNIYLDIMASEEV